MRERVRGLAGTYQGRRCFIMGNGPTLRDTDTRLLRDEVTIGSNGIFLFFDQMGYRPTFVTVEDRLVAEDRAAELNGIRGTTKIFPHDLTDCLRADADTLYVNFVRHYRGFPRFTAEFDRVAYWGGTVTFLNLQLAYYLGCRPIYLIGFDHNYSVPGAVESGPITSQSSDVNHFHPDYFGRGYRWNAPMLERMETAYRAARAFLESRGVEVFNATAGGRLEVFPRVNYQAVMGSDRALPPPGL